MKKHGMMREFVAVLLLLVAIAGMSRLYVTLQERQDAVVWNVNECCPDVRRIGRQLPSWPADKAGACGGQQDHPASRKYGNVETDMRIFSYENLFAAVLSLRGEPSRA